VVIDAKIRYLSHGLFFLFISGENFLRSMPKPESEVKMNLIKETLKPLPIPVFTDRENDSADLLSSWPLGTGKVAPFAVRRTTEFKGAEPSRIDGRLTGNHREEMRPQRLKQEDGSWP
jgi:hypothetical protein